MFNFYTSSTTTAIQHADGYFVTSLILNNNFTEIRVKNFAGFFVGWVGNYRGCNKAILVLIGQRYCNTRELKQVAIFIKGTASVLDDFKNYLWKTHHSTWLFSDAFMGVRR